MPVVTAAAAVANGCFQSFLCVRICPLITALSQSSSVPPALGAEASLLLAGGSLGPEELGDLPRVWPSLPGTAGRQGCRSCWKALHVLHAASADTCPQGHCTHLFPPPSSPSSMLSCLCRAPGLPSSARWSCPCLRVAATRMAPSLWLLWVPRQPWLHPVSLCQTQAPRAGGLSGQAGVALRAGECPSSPVRGHRKRRETWGTEMLMGQWSAEMGRASSG